MKVVYGRLGVPVGFVEVPAARALALSNSGLLDGEVHRVEGISRDFPSLIQISPAINFIQPAVFTTKLHFDVRGWESIKDYRVGIIRGVGSSEAGTKGMANVTRASDLDNLVRLLQAGRIDLLVTDLFSAEVAITKMRLDNCIYALPPPIEKIFIYHYLHQRHRELATRVATTIGEMAASGELATRREAAIGRLLNEARVMGASSSDNQCTR